MAPKEIKIPFLIKNSANRQCLYGFDGSKNYISFVEAQREIEHFLNSYRLVTFREYYSYAFNAYLNARLSKKEYNTDFSRRNDYMESDDPYVLAFERQFEKRSFGPEDVHADVERCTNYFLASGKMNLSLDRRLCYVDCMDKSKILFESGRVSEPYQMVVLFHIFFMACIKKDFVVPESTNEDEVYLKFLMSNGVMNYVTPIKSKDFCGGNMNNAVECAKQTLHILNDRESNDFNDTLGKVNNYIIIVPGSVAVKSLFKDKEFLSLADGKRFYFLDFESISKNMLKPKFIRLRI